MKFLLFIFIFLLSFSAFAENDILKIKSEPLAATVYVKSLSGKNKVKLGATPYSGSIDNLVNTYGKNGLFMVTLEKEGYEPNSVILSSVFKSDLDLFLTLGVKPVEEKKDEPKKDEPAKDQEAIKKEDHIAYDTKKMDKNINELFEAQRLIRLQQYDDAINLLKRTSIDQEGLSVVPELIASAYYLKRDMKAALFWYEKAYGMNPENKDSFTMKNYLMKKYGKENEKQ